MTPVRFGAAAVAAAVGLAASAAYAGPIYNFVQITNNGNAAVASQLSVEVNPAGPNQVDFTFRNTGPIASVIAGVYFDDGTLLGISSVINAPPGVQFVAGGGPGPADLPSGNTVNFETTAGFYANASAPPPQRGISPGEALTIRFNLIGGQTYADTLAAIALGEANWGQQVTGALRFGLHVISIDGAGSESFVNTGTPDGPEVPLPSVAAMGLVGLAAVARRRRLA